MTAPNSDVTIAVGSYTDGGTRPGISIFEGDASRSGWRLKQSLAAANASYLAGRNPMVAVCETPAGALSSFVQGRDGYRLVGHLGTVGAGPCHVRLLADGATVVVTNYVAGSIFVATIEPGGQLRDGRTLKLGPGTGPVAGRQQEPHPHQSIETPWGTIIVADLGADRLLEIELGGRALRVARIIALPPGSGPRHMTWFDGRLIVVGELDSRIYTLEVGQAVSGIAGSTPTYGGAPSMADAASQPSHIATSRSGKHVIVLNRGRDTVSLFSPRQDVLHLDFEVPTGGSWPRHFLELGDTLLVANQHSDSITELAIVNDFDGLALRDHAIQVGSPACIVALSDASGCQLTRAERY